MEKFAEKFCNDNPGVFDSALPAYVLAFSSIMLHTDQHNPTVKKKMTFDDFQRMNRGINNGKDLDAEFLLDIYTNVKDHEIKLQDDDKQRIRLEFSGHKTAEIYEKESETILEKSQKAFSRGHSRSHFYEVQDIEQVRPMFEAVWHSLLAVFSIILEQSEDPKFWNLCLEGYDACMKISSRF